MQALFRVQQQGMTVVKIAHRLNTIRDADAIAVVEGGKVYVCMYVYMCVCVFIYVCI
jgi:ABC-type multidrug transport system fused ATPase/permease subunit